MNRAAKFSFRRGLTLCLALSLALSAAAPAALAYKRYDGLAEKLTVVDKEHRTPTPKGMKHYLLLCMDSWKANMSRLGYSDGMVLLTLDEATGRVITTSLIRDMLVLHPDGKPGRLTYIAKEFGVQGLIDTINNHFDIQIEKYVLMDWGQVQAIVDAAGGVDLTISSAEASYLKRYAISPSSTKPRIQNGGTYHFSGHAAVIYMRMRKVAAINGETQDFGRTFRTRTVLKNLADSLRGITYEDAEKLLDTVLDNTLDTNLSAQEALEAFNTAYSLKQSGVEACRLPFDDTVRPFDYYGGAAQLIDFEKNRALFHDFLYSNSFVVAEEPQKP